MGQFSKVIIAIDNQMKYYRWPWSVDQADQV